MGLMVAIPNQDHCRFLRECVELTRARGSASVQVTQDTNIPEMPPEVAATAMHGQVDFTRDRSWMGVGSNTLMVADGSLLYERRDSDRWTCRQVQDGRHFIYDPRWPLGLLATGCQAAGTSAAGSYEVRFDPQRVTGSTVPGVAPSWAHFTGTVVVDEGLVRKASIRMATDSGDTYLEITLFLSAFGAPVTFTPPAPGTVTDYEEYLTEKLA